MVEIRRDGQWLPLLDVLKPTPDLDVVFKVRRTDGLRLVIYRVACPPTWYNRVACLSSVEVSQGLTAVEARTISAIKSLY